MTGRSLRPADHLIAPAVADALRAAPEVQQTDEPLVRLAKAYARAIDAGPTEEGPDPLATYGPKLVGVLDALLATPKARAATRRGVPGGNQGPTKLDALRADRAS